jgi:ADP-ribose pyrophosphatase YjhB (NUDIX family)
MKKKNWLSEKLYKKIFTKYFPRITVDIVIRDKKGIVLIKRDILPEIGCWHLPGGLIRYGENILDAVKRESLEETGLKIKITKFIGIHDNRYLNFHDVTLVFLANRIAGKLRGSEEGKEVNYFKKLPNNIGFDHIKEIRFAIKNEKPPLGVIL